MQLAHVYRCRDSNLGDRMSAPGNYFPWLATDLEIDAWCDDFSSTAATRMAIVGGGGLVRNKPGDRFHDILQDVADSAAVSVGWGIGHNHHYAEPGWSGSNSYPEYLKKFDLLGIRDWGTDFEWVPCASCLHPVFDEQYGSPEHEVALYEHWQDFSVTGITGLPAMRNSEQSLDAVVSFLASAETVVTNSYHGCYWATLLGRKVVVVEPFSTKFSTFRHPPVMSSKHSWRAMLPDAQAYPDALDECRSANQQFAHKVRQLMTQVGAVGSS